MLYAIKNVIQYTYDTKKGCRKDSLFI